MDRMAMALCGMVPSHLENCACVPLRSQFASIFSLQYFHLDY